MTGWYRWDGEDLRLSVRVAPRSGRDEFGEVLDGRIKLRITAAPVDGQANAHLVRFLAKHFRVPMSQVVLVSGETSRDKSFRIARPRQLPASIARPA